MKYDVRLQLETAYRPPAAGSRHLVRVTPVNHTFGQRVIASSVDFDPVPVERADRHDFFGNTVVSVAYVEPHATLRVSMSARVRVDTQSAMLDVSPDLASHRRELAATLSLAPESPHHFTAASPHVALSDGITAYARESVTSGATVREVVEQIGQRIHADFEYDADSTEVETAPAEVFEQRRGVCQDFTHVMIAGLRGIGLPASYVSGFLRTIPPKGRPRLAGADAMHAWVRVWCGTEMGWVGYDPTNGTFVGEDHILVAVGRDYQDVAPIAGVLRTSGRQRNSQSVDVVPV